MAKRGCIFCGRARLTIEHILPQWMSDILEDDPRRLDGEHAFQRWSIVGDEDPSNQAEWRSKDALDFTAKCVCGKCNSGWMSDLEDAAKPIVAPMIRGKKVELDTESQAILASWACLKAMVGRYTHQPPTPIPQDWLDEFYRTRTPPYGWAVLTIAYTGHHPAIYAGHKLSLSSASTGTPVGADDGVLMSVICGYFAMKVIGIRGERLTHASPPYLTVWPTSVLTLLWPPQQVVTDDTLDDFLASGMYLRGTGS